MQIIQFVKVKVLCDTRKSFEFEHHHPYLSLAVFRCFVLSGRPDVFTFIHCQACTST